MPLNFSTDNLELPMEKIEFKIVRIKNGKPEWESTPSNGNHLIDLTGYQTAQIQMIEGEEYVQISKRAIVFI